MQVKDPVRNALIRLACEKFHKALEYAAFARTGERARMREDRPSQNVEIARALSVGLTWALSTALFLFLGRLVEGWVGTRPVFTLVGAFIWAAAGFYYVYHQIAQGGKSGRGPQDRNGKPGA